MVPKDETIDDRQLVKVGVGTNDLCGRGSRTAHAS